MYNFCFDGGGISDNTTTPLCIAARKGADASEFAESVFSAIVDRERTRIFIVHTVSGNKERQSDSFLYFFMKNIESGSLVVSLE